MNKYPEGQPSAIVIHHAASDINETAEKITRYHVDIKGWDGCGYHKVIEYPRLNIKLTDLIKDGRPEEFVGAHCLNFNSKSLGVCLVGNWTTLMPHPAQLDALVIQLHVWMDKYNILPSNIFTHREKWLNQEGERLTECPGDALQEIVDKIRKALILSHETPPALPVPEISDSSLSPTSHVDS